jgi:hypothetical protein
LSEIFYFLYASQNDTISPGSAQNAVLEKSGNKRDLTTRHDSNEALNREKSALILIRRAISKRNSKEIENKNISS